MNILIVPITIVASKDTFSTGSRVIDPYAASLGPQTLSMLMSTSDCC